MHGSRNTNGFIRAGGVIRDSSGIWCFGFMRKIGNGEVLQAEAWGLLTGLQLAAELGLNHLAVESDSATLINLLQNNDFELHPLGTLLSNCRSLMQSFGSRSIYYAHSP